MAAGSASPDYGCWRWARPGGSGELEEFDLDWSEDVLSCPCGYGCGNCSPQALFLTTKVYFRLKSLENEVKADRLHMADRIILESYFTIHAGRDNMGKN